MFNRAMFDRSPANAIPAASGTPPAPPPLPYIGGSTFVGYVDVFGGIDPSKATRVQ